MEIIEDESKRQVKWWNANYFFAATIAIVVTNIYIFAFKNDWQATAFPIDNTVNYHDRVYLEPLLRGFFQQFFTC